jgi:hypothetical protein
MGTMKLLLVTILIVTVSWVAYAQTDSSPAAKTDCKEQHTDKAKKGKAKPARDGAQASTDPAKAAAVCPPSPDPAPDAAPASTTPTPTPTAALSSASVAPPVDNRQLNVTISHDPEESLGAAARRIRAKKAVEEASKSQ